ncbi:MAG: ornithine carbamoyltransferase, partial [Bacteroidota bacterium]
AKSTGANVMIKHDPGDAVTGADVVYTDVWASMGQESEQEERRKIFRPCQVNGQLMRKAGPGALFMHCLPAHRGDEVTDEVIDGPASVVFQQAENRLHVQKALLVELMRPR